MSILGIADGAPADNFLPAGWHRNPATAPTSTSACASVTAVSRSRPPAPRTSNTQSVLAVGVEVIQGSFARDAAPRRADQLLRKPNLVARRMHPECLKSLRNSRKAPILIRSKTRNSAGAVTRTARFRQARRNSARKRPARRITTTRPEGAPPAFRLSSFPPVGRNAKPGFHFAIPRSVSRSQLVTQANTKGTGIFFIKRA